MSSADIAVKVFRELTSQDLRVLQVIETGLSEHEYVSREQVARFTKLDAGRDVDFRIGRLNKLGLIYQMRGAYIGYTLNFAGYDCLAINALVRAGFLEAFGKSLGVGKEADVFDAVDPKGKRIAVKFQRLGRISFRQTIRKRSYTQMHSAGWLYQSRLAAEREFQALKLLYPRKVAVPEPIGQNRHAVVMGVIEGGRLVDYRKIAGPVLILRQILRNVRKAYLAAGIIHADLSEYNIILKPDGHILIIDWPQYITRDHPNAQELLKRDLNNVLTYFMRKSRLRVEIGDVLEYIVGRMRKLPV